VAVPPAPTEASAAGTLRGWGTNNWGQLDDGTKIAKPTPVPALNLRDVVAIAGGMDHALALKADGTVWAVGYDAGKLGDGTATTGAAASRSRSRASTASGSSLASRPSRPPTSTTWRSWATSARSSRGARTPRTDRIGPRTAV
jgi:hypothetical protein